MTLSDLGAEVWTIGHSGGDEVRKCVPPVVNGQSCYFLCMNRNKKSIALDLSKPQGQQLARGLALKADVLTEDFKTGHMKKFVLDYEAFSAQNPRLIYCSLTGYAPMGPYATDPGYDIIAEAVGGFMRITRPKADLNSTETPEPCKAGVAVTDIMAGLYAHGAILASLLQRHKTGQGELIHCNLLSTQMTALANIASNYLNAGVEGRPWVTEHESIVPYQVFRTKDGRHYIVGAGDDNGFRELCRLLELPELADSPDYATNRDRVKNRKSLLRILGGKFASNDLNYWRKTIRSEKFPSGPVNTVGEAFAHEQVQHLGLIQAVVHPSYGRVKVTGPPVLYRYMTNEVRSAPPLLDEHTSEVLRKELGWKSIIWGSFTTLSIRATAVSRSQYRHMVNEVRSAPPMLGEHTSEVLRKELGLTEGEISRLQRDKVIQ
ncbi:formyl-coenzyme A transferase [Aphelenchoides avenae]|nr:formyl-coenzyme A transferase [Aphelenchus avenae]